MEGIREHLRQHDQRFDALEKRIDGKLDALEERIDGKLDALEERIDGKLDALEKRIDGKFDALEGRLDRKIGGLGVQIENVHSTVQLLAEQMSGFVRANADVRGRVDCLEEKQQMTELRLKALERRGKRPGL